MRVGYEATPLEEMFIEGWNLTHLHSDYKDHRMHWDIVMMTAHGTVAVARLTQYKKRDWFDLATPLQHAVLGRLGYYRDGADVATQLEAATKQALRHVGLNIRGGYGASAATGALDGAPLPTDADLPENRPSVAPPAPLAIELPPPPDNPRWTAVGDEQDAPGTTRLDS